MTLATKKLFVRYVSHEIRTPLNTVSLGLEVLNQKVDYYSTHSLLFSSRFDKSGGRDILEMIQEIYDSCQIALDIVNDLLFYDKIEDKKLILYKQKLNGCQFVEKTVRTFSLQAISKNIALEYHHEEIGNENTTRNSSILINADESKLSQVIRNLVSNALKFTPQGGNITITSKFIPSNLLLKSKPSQESVTESVGTTLISWLHVISHQFIDVARLYFATSSRFSTSSVTPYDEEPDIELGQIAGIIKGIFRVEVKDTGPGISKVRFLLFVFLLTSIPIGKSRKTFQICDPI